VQLPSVSLPRQERPFLPEPVEVQEPFASARPPQQPQRELGELALAECGDFTQTTLPESKCKLTNKLYGKLFLSYTILYIVSGKALAKRLAGNI